MLALLGLRERPLVGTYPKRHNGAGLRSELTFAYLQERDVQ
jgi:hypothetical protein